MNYTFETYADFRAFIVKHLTSNNETTLSMDDTFSFSFENNKKIDDVERLFNVNVIDYNIERFLYNEKAHLDVSTRPTFKTAFLDDRTTKSIEWNALTLKGRKTDEQKLVTLAEGKSINQLKAMREKLLKMEMELLEQQALNNVEPETNNNNK